MRFTNGGGVKAAGLEGGSAEDVVVALRGHAMAIMAQAQSNAFMPTLVADHVIEV